MIRGERFDFSIRDIINHTTPHVIKKIKIGNYLYAVNYIVMKFAFFQNHVTLLMLKQAQKLVQVDALETLCNTL